MSLQQNVDFIINAPEAVAQTDQVRNSILGVGDAAEQSVQRVERSVETLNNSQRAGAAAAGRSFNGLQNSINQISRELPAFTYSAQTGFMAISNNIPILVDEIGRLRAANALLVASGQTAVPVWRQLISSLFSWGTAMSVGITLLTVFGKEIGNFIGSLFKGKEAINAAKMQLQALNKALESTDYKKAITGINELRINIDLAKRGLLSKKDVLEQYNKSIGATTGQVKSLDAAEQAMAKNAKAYIEMTLYKAAAQLSLEAAAKKAYEAEVIRRKKLEEYAEISDSRVSTGGTAGFGTGQFNAQEYNAETQRINKARQARQKEEADAVDRAKNAELSIAQKFQEDAAKIAAANNFDFFGKGGKDDKKNDRDFAAILASRKALLDKLRKLDAEYSRKGFTKDDEEVQALKDKFEEFRKVIEAENKKIAEYNKTHKKKLDLIDTSSIAPIETQALEDLKYRQGTEKLKVSLAEQQKLYADFEEYRIMFGEAKAKERYQKEIDVSKTYLQTLTDEYNKLANDKDKDSFSGVQKERLKYLSETLKQEQRLNEGNVAKLLSDLQAYEKKRQDIEEAAQRKIDELRAKGHKAEAENLRVKSEAELTEFDKTYVEQMKSYKDLFNNIDTMATATLKSSVASLQAEVSKLKLTPEAKAFFDRVFGDLKKRTDRQGAEDFKQIASSLDEAGRFASVFSENLGKSFSVAANIADQIGNIKQGIGNFNTATSSKDVFGQISAGISVFGAITGILSGIAGLFDNSAKVQQEREESLRRQVDLIESVNKRMREQIELNKEMLGDNRIKGYAQSMADVTFKIEEQNKKLREQYQLTGNKFVDNIVQNNDASFVGTKALDKYKAATTLKNLTEAQIRELYDQGMLDDRAKAAYDSLIELRKQQKDLLVEMNKELTGIDFNGLLDGFADIFRNEEPTVDDFANYFEKKMREAQMNAFKRDVLEESLKDWYLMFADLSQDGLTEGEKAQLKADYDRRVKEIQAKAKELEQLTGTPLADPDFDDSNSSKGILKKEVTEETASRLIGMANASYDIEKQELFVHKTSMEIYVKQLHAQNELVVNTAAMVAAQALTNDKLDKIIDNTKPALGGRNLGI